MSLAEIVYKRTSDMASLSQDPVPDKPDRIAELRRYVLGILDHPERIWGRQRADGEGVVAFTAQAVVMACVVEMMAERMSLGTPTGWTPP